MTLPHAQHKRACRESSLSRFPEANGSGSTTGIHLAVYIISIVVTHIQTGNQSARSYEHEDRGEMLVSSGLEFEGGGQFGLQRGDLQQL